jgi:hypothetical protein
LGAAIANVVLTACTGTVHVLLRLA